ncbi:hypothetical protein D3C76_1075160 [compost metagenome]
MLLQVLGDGLGIAAMTLHAQVQGLHTAHQQGGILGRHYRAGHVLEAFKPNPAHQCLAPDHQAGGDIAMAAQVLGRRMHHQVRPQFQRSLQVGRAVGVIDHHGDSVLVRKRCHGSDIGHLHVRVGRCFEVDHLGLPADRRFKRLQVSHVDMADLDPELTDAVVQKGKGAAVQSTPYQHLITWPQQGPQGRGDCAHP